MRPVFLLFLLFSISTSFSLFGNRKETVTRPDEGELSGRSLGNPNLGREITVGKGRSNINQGDEIFIPRNTGIGSGTINDEEETTHRITPKIKTTTERPHFSERPRMPESASHVGCPSRIDAYATVQGTSYLFDGNQVHTIRNNRIISSDPVDRLFPGVSQIKGAVYDPEKELLVLFSDRKVYGFRKSGSLFSLHRDYPKDLPETIAFSPNSALRWHDGHQMVLSSGGMFALYDEYWNKSLMSGRISSYFEGLPDRVRGVSDWNNGKGQIFTQNLVFEYDKSSHGTIGEGKPISSFFHC